MNKIFTLILTILKDTLKIAITLIPVFICIAAFISGVVLFAIGWLVHWALSLLGFFLACLCLAILPHLPDIP